MTVLLMSEQKIREKIGISGVGLVPRSNYTHVLAIAYKINEQDLTFNTNITVSQH